MTDHDAELDEEDLEPPRGRTSVYPDDMHLYASLQFSKNLLARIFGIAPESLDRLVRGGVCSKNAATGMYDCQAISDYIESIRNKGVAGALAQQPETLLELDQDARARITGQNALVLKLIEEARLTRARADAQELQVAERHAELLPADMVLELCGQVAAAVRQSLLVLHTKVQSRVADVPLPVVSAVKELAYEALTEISDTGIPEALAREMAVRHNPKAPNLSMVALGSGIETTEPPADPEPEQPLLFGGLSFDEH